MTEIWTRQEGETTRQYVLFTTYRDIGPERTIAKVPEIYQKATSKRVSYDYVAKLSQKHAWIKRAAAYDDYKDELCRQKNEAAIEAMNKRQAQEYQEQQTQAMEEIKKATDGYKLNIATLAYDRAAKGERLARGVATERKETEHSGSIDSNQTHKVLFKDKLQADILEDEGYGGSET